jgi:hypothetical protein
MTLYDRDDTVGIAMTMHAIGRFDVKLEPRAPDHGHEREHGAAIGRMTIDKRFEGDLDATSKGQMLAFLTNVGGSAGYVAMEIVSGRLHGRSGDFVLQHNGTMAHGARELSVTVVPDSGTGELQGLAGSMAIIVASGEHSYAFDYTLPDSA